MIDVPMKSGDVPWPSKIQHEYLCPEILPTSTRSSRPQKAIYWDLKLRKNVQKNLQKNPPELFKTHFLLKNKQKFVENHLVWLPTNIYS